MFYKLFRGTYRLCRRKTDGFVDLMTYEEIDTQTFYHMVGFGAVTLPTTRQGMLMREMDNRAVLDGITIPTLLVHGRNDRVILPATSDYIAHYIPHTSRIVYDQFRAPSFLAHMAYQSGWRNAPESIIIDALAGAILVAVIANQIFVWTHSSFKEKCWMF